MRRIAWAVCFLVVLALRPAAAQDWAAKMFPTTAHDFGSLARGAKAQYAFTFSNPYVEEVHVAGVRSSCGCTSVRVDLPTVKTHGTSAVIATINTLHFEGKRGATITVTIDKPYFAEVQLHTSCYIRTDVVFQPGSVDLGSVDQGAKVQRTVTVGYVGRSDWQVLEVRSANPHLSAKPVEVARGGGRVTYQLLVELDPNAPPGYINDHLMLITNDRVMTHVPLAVQGRVESAITVSPASLFLGMVQPGQKVTKQLVVRGKRPFRVLSVTCDGEGFAFDTSGETEAKLIHIIPLSFVAGADPGKRTHTIRIETDLGRPAPQLPAYAVVAR